MLKENNTMFERNTKSKITLGYLLLIIILIAAMGYIYSKIRIFSNEEHNNELLAERLRLTGIIIDELNKADITGQAIAIGELGEFKQYKSQMKQVSIAVDSLLLLTNDTIHYARLDTVKLLIARKNRNMQKVLNVIRETGINEIFTQRIDSIISIQENFIDSIPSNQHRVITHTKSYNKPTQKSFLKRLGELFIPPKADTTVISDTIIEEHSENNDIIIDFADSITSLLLDAREQAIDTHLQHTNKLYKQIHILQLSSLQLSQKVNQILASIEEEQRLLFKQQQNNKENLQSNSAKAIALIAIVAIMLATIFLILIWRDIARSAHYRKELEKAKQRAEELLKAREQLMLTITHDIKAPASTISGYIELAKKLTNDERMQFYMKNMHESSEHLLQLINTLLDYHRLDANKMDLQHVDFNGKELFDNIALGFTPTAESKQLQFIYRCDDNLDQIFKGDPLRMRQIVENLITNAIKFTTDGYVSLEALYENNKLSLSISDTGRGISKDEQELIFKEFTRLRNAEGCEGFGLGLSIVHRLISLLNGTISFESEIDKGTTFKLSVPLNLSDTKTDETKEYNYTTVLPSANILLIDDDSLQLQMMTAMLHHSSLTISTSTSANKAIEMLQQNRYDLILTDIQMPGMNGIELIKSISDITDAPVIAVTARNDIDIDNIKKYGFASLLRKPFTSKELVSKITEHIEKGKFNFEALTIFSMEDKEATIEIMQTFVTETKKKLELLSLASNEKNIQNVTNITHQLLPIFSMINATKSVPHLEWFEKQRREEKYPEDADERLYIIAEEAKRIIEEAEINLEKVIKQCTND